MSEFEYSHDKHVLGTDWKSRVRDKEDLQITAYHEAGHTLVAYFTEYAQPLHKVGQKRLCTAWILRSI
jgi:ATP-dependent Zn protease